MYYAQDLIEEIRVQNDIVDVISEYIPLKQKGGSYFGLCPFHNEQTPSFSVNSEKQFYYCFGCGAAGNAYSFIMQMENCDFVEAVKRLADRAHITLPESEYSIQAQELEKLKNTLYDIHKIAGRFYYDELHTEAGANALSYLNGRRIVTGIQKKFGIGYAPTGRQILYSKLKEKGFSTQAMIKSGLVMEDKTGNGFHDRFYNRLMFPIFDVQGRCIGFGGRIIEKGEPKYLNSPETTLFNKSKTLYGLNFARLAKKKEVIIVEGYMDMISIYQAGIHNVVASLGTAFNIEHAKLLKRYADSVILLYDSDDAGTNAALRAIPILVSNGFRVKVLQVPDGKDPDEYIKQNGPQEFSKLLLNAENYILFQVNCIRKRYNMQNTEHKVLFTTEAAEVLSKAASDIEMDVYTKEISEYTGISEDAIKSEINKIRNKADTAYAVRAEKNKFRVYTEENKDVVNRKSKGIIQAQRNVLYVCASYKDIYVKIIKYLSPEDFPDSIYEKMAELIFNMNENNREVFPAEILNHFESVEEQKLVTEVFAVRLNYDSTEAMEKAVNEGVKIIKRAKIDKLAANAVDIDDVYKLTEAKRKLDELYITISDG